MQCVEDNLYLFIAARALTLREAAEALGVSVGQVRGLVDDGVLSAIDIGRGSERRHLRLTEAAIESLSAPRPRPSPGPGPAPAPRVAVPAERELDVNGYAKRRAERQAVRGAKALRAAAAAETKKKDETAKTGMVAWKGAKGDAKQCLKN